MNLEIVSSFLRRKGGRKWKWTLKNQTKQRCQLDSPLNMLKAVNTEQFGKLKKAGVLCGGHILF